MEKQCIIMAEIVLTGICGSSSLLLCCYDVYLPLIELVQLLLEFLNVNRRPSFQLYSVFIFIVNLCWFWYSSVAL